LDSIDVRYAAVRAPLAAALFSILVLMMAPVADSIFAQNRGGHVRPSTPRQLDTSDAYNKQMVNIIKSAAQSLTGGWSTVIWDGIEGWVDWEKVQKQIEKAKACLTSRQTDKPEDTKRKKEIKDDVENQERILRELHILKAAWTQSFDFAGLPKYEQWAKYAKKVIDKTVKKSGQSDFDEAIKRHLDRIQALTEDECKNKEPPIRKGGAGSFTCRTTFEQEVVPSLTFVQYYQEVSSDEDGEDGQSSSGAVQDETDQREGEDVEGPGETEPMLPGPGEPQPGPEPQQPEPEEPEPEPEPQVEPPEGFKPGDVPPPPGAADNPC
jgi:hypothetical protein